MIKLLQVFALIFSFAIGVNQAAAVDVGAQVGARINKSTVPNASSKDQVGFQAGILAVFPIVPMVGFRTGGLLVQRDARFEYPDTTANRLFLDIPLTIQANLGVAKLYAGADLGLKVSSSCSRSGGDCTLRDEQSLVLQPVAGVDFSILPLFSLGAFYEFENEYSRNWKQSAFGVTGTLMF